MPFRTPLPRNHDSHESDKRKKKRKKTEKWINDDRCISSTTQTLSTLGQTSGSILADRIDWWTMILTQVDYSGKNLTDSRSKVQGIGSEQILLVV